MSHVGGRSNESIAIRADLPRCAPLRTAFTHAILIVKRAPKRSLRQSHDARSHLDASSSLGFFAFPFPLPLPRPVSLPLSSFVFAPIFVLVIRRFLGRLLVRFLFGFLFLLLDHPGPTFSSLFLSICSFVVAQPDTTRNGNGYGIANPTPPRGCHHREIF